MDDVFVGFAAAAISHSSAVTSDRNVTTPAFIFVLNFSLMIAALNETLQRASIHIFEL